MPSIPDVVALSARVMPCPTEWGLPSMIQLLSPGVADYLEISMSIQLLQV